MTSALSPYKLRKARRLYDTFNALNALAFTLLSGNVITLYAMRLGATAGTLGLLAAFPFVSFFFMPVGKRLVRSSSIVRVFAGAWFARYLFMLPLLAAPAAEAAGRLDIAIALMTGSVFLFQASRGVGMIGNNPVLNSLASGGDRGAYMTYIQIINSAVGLSVNAGLAVLLGRRPSLVVYSAIIAAGIATGIAGSLLLFRIPEPARSEKEGAGDFFATIRKAFSSGSFRLFVAVFFLVCFVSSVARAFAVVHSRAVYEQGDGAIAFLTVFGGLGALAMGMMTRLLVDRVGAKPLYIVYTLVAACALVPVVVSPSLHSGAGVLVFLACLHFGISFAFAGTEGVAQTYFFGLVDPDDMLDLSILYYFVFGAAGAAGSLAGGFALEWMGSAGLSPVASYRVLFGILFGLLAVALFLQRFLVRLGALSFRGALGVILSFRDLKAITLLDKLEKSTDPDEEEALLYALHDSPSSVALAELLSRLDSPRLSVRLEAIRAIEALEELTEEARAALMADAEKNLYTTAYASARILGKRGVSAAAPILRAGLETDDYLLVGECMVALARLGDAASVGRIEALVADTANPRVALMGVAALEVFRSPTSVPVLLDLLRTCSPSPYLRDEAILSLAGILGADERFYPLFLRYREDPSLAAALASDAVESAAEASPRRRAAARARRRSAQGAPDRDPGSSGSADSGPDALRTAAAALLEAGDGAPYARFLHSSGMAATLSGALLAEASLEADLVSYVPFRLLLVSWACDRFAGRA